MTDQETPPRSPDAGAIAPAGATGPLAPPEPVVAPPPASNGAAGRPELLIGASFVGAFVTAKLLKRVAG